jgi:hypothetical protein
MFIPLSGFATGVLSVAQLRLASLQRRGGTKNATPIGGRTGANVPVTIGLQLGDASAFGASDCGAQHTA